MSVDSVRVVAPAQLHFGLLSFGDSSVRQYGGCGLMLAAPTVQLQLVQSGSFKVSGPCAERVKAFAETWSRNTGHPLHGEIRIESAIPPHVGLGSGTQMGLSVAAGLFRLLSSDVLPPPSELAASVGRGMRSAVGSFGFARGGFVAEAGKLSNEPLGELICRLGVPSTWRFVLVRPTTGQGRSGESERAAFAGLPRVPLETTARLASLLRDQIVPALEAEAFEPFGKSISEFGRLSGSCFAACQGGAFADRQIESLVEKLQAFGVTGVGQTSWGPTVFALAESEQTASGLVEEIRGSATGNDGDVWDVRVAAPNNTGAVMTQASGEQR